MRVIRALQTVVWDRQDLPTIIERFIIGGGLILSIEVYRYNRLFGRQGGG